MSGKAEIITGRERRRRWSVEDKLRIVAEWREPGARVTDVAARHGVYPDLLFSLRRQVREGSLAPLPAATFVPVRMAAADARAEPAGGNGPGLNSSMLAWWKSPWRTAAVCGLTSRRIGVALRR